MQRKGIAYLCMKCIDCFFVHLGNYRHISYNYNPKGSNLLRLFDTFSLEAEVDQLTLLGKGEERRCGGAGIRYTFAERGRSYINTFHIYLPCSITYFTLLN